MNGQDMLDFVKELGVDQAGEFQRITRVQNKAAYRLATQIRNRNPVTSEVEGAVEQFVVFANWLQDCQTLENTFVAEGQGGQPRFRSLQMTANEVAILRSEELRRVIRRPDGRSYLERWIDWAMPALEQKLNRWRHLPGSDLPLRIVVFHEDLRVEPENQKLLDSYGRVTLRFAVVERS